MGVIFLIVSVTVPTLASTRESVYGWWITQGATITVNDEAIGIVERYGFVGKGDRVCALEYMHVGNQVVTMIYKGKYSEGKAKISFLRSIKGEYLPEDGPLGTLDFFLGRTVLVRHMYFRRDISPRTSVFDRFTGPMPQKYVDELERECSTVL